MERTTNTNKIFETKEQAEMKILTYRELESTDELLPLLDHAFRWTFNQRTFDKLVKIDPRLKNSPVSFCALENGHIVGNVGVMDIATKTLNGTIEYVGGIYGVATLPSHTKRGVSTTLMNQTHEYFRDRGYRFSLLGTSHTIIAHAFYQKLGYSDLFECPSAYKVTRTKTTKPRTKEKPEKIDFDRLLKIYNRRVKDCNGLTIRDKSYLEMLKKGEGFTPKECIIEEDGYVLFKEIKGMWVNGVWIRELVAQNPKTMNKLLELAEKKAKEMIYDRAVMDKELLEVYRSRGYMIQERSHSVMLVKPLATGASFNQTYGSKLYMTGLDFF
jgi:predicted acetyltransferase